MLASLHYRHTCFFLLVGVGLQIVSAVCMFTPEGLFFLEQTN